MTKKTPTQRIGELRKEMNIRLYGLFGIIMIIFFFLVISYGGQIHNQQEQITTLNTTLNEMTSWKCVENQTISHRDIIKSPFASEQECIHYFAKHSQTSLPNRGFFQWLDNVALSDCYHLQKDLGMYDGYGEGDTHLPGVMCNTDKIIEMCEKLDQVYPQIQIESKTFCTLEQQTFNGRTREVHYEL